MKVRPTIIVLVMTMIPWSSVHAVTDEERQQQDERHYVMSSRPLNDLRLSGSAGLSLVILPQPLTEYPTPAPMVDLRGKLNMPLGLAAYGRAASNIATSILQGGGMWGASVGDFSASVGYSVAFVYGVIDYVDGFNTKQRRWINYPMATVGWSFPKATLTARFEVEITTSKISEIEGQPTNAERNLVTGGAFTLTLEQPFFADRHILIGMTLQSSSDPYQAWFLYNQFQDRLFSSEFFIGFIL
jgi:hypothetical protein